MYGYHTTDVDTQHGSIYVEYHFFMNYMRTVHMHYSWRCQHGVLSSAAQTSPTDR